MTTSHRQDHGFSYEVFMPSADEITTRAAEIRATWDEETLQKRAGSHTSARVELLPVRVLIDRKKLA